MKDKFNFHFCFKCIISSEAPAITWLSSQSVILLWGITIAGSHTCTLRRLIMCRAKIIIVDLEEASEIQGPSPEMGTAWTLDQETSLNIQQLKWLSLNRHTALWVISDSPDQEPRIPNVRLKNQGRIPRLIYRFNLTASVPLWTNFVSFSFCGFKQM